MFNFLGIIIVFFALEYASLLKATANLHNGEITVCQNDNVIIKFGGFDTEDAALKYFLKRNSNKLKPIASKLNQTKGYGRYVGRVTFLDNGDLGIKNVSIKDSGIYILEVRNGGTKNSTTHLRVLAPPTGAPKFLNRTSNDGSLFLECKEPAYQGSPKAEMKLKDSRGRRQKELAFTINDKEYQCCLEGEAVDRCFPKEKSPCAHYKGEKEDERKQQPAVKNVTISDAAVEDNHDSWTIVIALLVLLIALVIVLVIAIMIFLWRQRKRKGKANLPDDNRREHLNIGQLEQTNFQKGTVKTDEDQQESQLIIEVNDKEQETRRLLDCKHQNHPEAEILKNIIITGFEEDEKSRRETRKRQKIITPDYISSEESGEEYHDREEPGIKKRKKFIK